MSSIQNLKRSLQETRVRSAQTLLRAVCGNTRFKLIVLLRKNRDGLNVTEMARTLNASLSRISHQLRILRKHRVVYVKERNREAIYTLGDHNVNKLLASLNL